MGDVEFWGNLKGTSRVPEARGLLNPYPLTMGKAALILLSQTEDPQARREGLPGSVTSSPWSLEVGGGSWAGSGPQQGTLSKEPPSKSLKMNSENPHGMRKTNHLQPAREPQTMPRTEWTWTTDLTQKALWKPLY